MKFESAFEKAWGRRPSADELVEIQRVKDGFDVQDNDALLTIAGLLLWYRREYRRIPDQCAEAVRQALNESLSAGARLCVDAIEQSFTKGLAAAGARWSAHARQTAQAEVALAMAAERRAQLRKGLSWAGLLGLWVAYAMLLRVLCFYAGIGERAWLGVIAAVAGFAGCQLLAQGPAQRVIGKPSTRPTA